MKKNEKQITEKEVETKRKFPQFDSIRTSRSGDYVIFSLNPSLSIVVNTRYLERILETAKKRQQGAA